MSGIVVLSPERLRSDWARLRLEGLNNRAIAARLQVPEAELVASGEGQVSSRLRANALELFERARSLGRLKWVVRNDHAVLERPGELGGVRCGIDAVVATGDTFELRLAQQACASAFALKETTTRGVKRSLQLFDGEGRTLVKIVLRGDSSPAAFESLIRDLGDRSPSTLVIEPTASSTPLRTQGEPASLAGFLAAAAEHRLPLRWSVKNRGARLASISSIRRVKRSDRAPWINVLDPELDLHLHEQALTRVSAELHGTAGTFHWLTPSGERALSVEAPQAFEILYEAARRLPACESPG